MADFLFLFSVSPVQSFISQARKTKDLYAGSRILSELIKTQLEEIKNLTENTKIIFPNEKAVSAPNRFLIKIKNSSEKEIIDFGKHLQNNFNKSFLSLAKKSHKLIIRDFHFSQLNDLFSINWIAIPIETDYKTAYLQLEKLHAATKNIRTFNQLNNGKGEQGRKCSLCGERNAYFYNSHKKPAFIDSRAIGLDSKELNKNEALCTVCAVKRFFPNSSFLSTAEIALKGIISQQEMKKLSDSQLFYEENLNENYFKQYQIDSSLKDIKEMRNNILKQNNLKSSELPKYYALIMFDGDNMGKLLSGSELTNNADLENFHEKLSEALAENARKAKEIVNKVGKTVYAGGDDFLGFVPLKELFGTLKLLNEAFEKEVNDKLKGFVKNEITMTAGVAIAHYKMPLHIVLDWTRKMEEYAKETGYRNSFAIAVLKHSGEIHKTVWKWKDKENNKLNNLQKIIEYLSFKPFSTNFIYTLEEEFSTLDYLENKTYIRQFETELKRLIHKSNINAKEDDEKELFHLCNDFIIDAEEKIDNYFSLMRLIAFIAHQLGGEK